MLGWRAKWRVVRLRWKTRSCRCHSPLHSVFSTEAKQGHTHTVALIGSTMHPWTMLQTLVTLLASLPSYSDRENVIQTEIMFVNEINVISKSSSSSALPRPSPPLHCHETTHTIWIILFSYNNPASLTPSLHYKHTHTHTHTHTHLLLIRFSCYCILVKASLVLGAWRPGSPGCRHHCERVSITKHWDIRTTSRLRAVECWASCEERADGPQAGTTESRDLYSCPRILLTETQVNQPVSHPPPFLPVF